MSQAELAKHLGVDIKTVGNWERGKTAPDAEQVWNCAVALGCTPNDICGWYIDRPQNRPTPPGNPTTAELLQAYESCTPERQDAMLGYARDQSFLSGGTAKRDGVQEERAA